MTIAVCWFCEAPSRLELAGSPTIVDESVWNGHEHERQVTISGMFRCVQCGRPSLGMAPFRNTNVYNETPDEWGGMLDRSSNIVWTPQRAEVKPFPSVPGHIGDAATEAYRCLSIQANRAAVQMARAVLEATAKHLDITEGRIVDKINAMRDQDHIRPRIADAAHQVRHFGNDMAHGDFTEPVPTDDAELVLELMSAVLDEVFQLPSRIDAAEAKVQARKAAAQARQAGGTDVVRADDETSLPEPVSTRDVIVDALYPPPIPAPSPPPRPPLGALNRRHRGDASSASLGGGRREPTPSPPSTDQFG